MATRAAIGRERTTAMIASKSALATGITLGRLTGRWPRSCAPPTAAAEPLLASCAALSTASDRPPLKSLDCGASSTQMRDERSSGSIMTMSRPK